MNSADNEERGGIIMNLKNVFTERVFFRISTNVLGTCSRYQPLNPFD